VRRIFVERAKRKTREGVVISNKMQKTVVVKIERKFRHPLYDKVIKRSKKYKAHDEESACKIGDRVLIMETRPISRDKRFRVVEILGQGKKKVDIIEPELKRKVEKPEFQQKAKEEVLAADVKEGKE
jgi:small subunit ribosomal protein S17